MCWTTSPCGCLILRNLILRLLDKGLLVSKRESGFVLQLYIYYFVIILLSFCCHFIVVIIIVVVVITY